MQLYQRGHPSIQKVREISQEEVGLMLRLEGCARCIGVHPLKNASVFFRNKGSVCELGRSLENLNN